MSRFNFTNITLQTQANITDVMNNFNKIENLGITEKEVNVLITEAMGFVNQNSQKISQLQTEIDSVDSKAVAVQNNLIDLEGNLENNYYTKTQTNTLINENFAEITKNVGQIGATSNVQDYTNLPSGFTSENCYIIAYKVRIGSGEFYCNDYGLSSDGVANIRVQLTDNNRLHVVLFNNSQSARNFQYKVLLKKID